MHDLGSLSPEPFQPPQMVGCKVVQGPAEVPPHNPHRFCRLAATRSQQGPKKIRTKMPTAERLLAARPRPQRSAWLSRSLLATFKARCSSHYLETKQTEAWRERAAVLKPRTQLQSPFHLLVCPRQMGKPSSGEGRPRGQGWRRQTCRPPCLLSAPPPPRKEEEGFLSRVQGITFIPTVT